MRTTAAALFVTLPPGPVEAAPPKTDGLTPLTIEVPQKTVEWSA